LNRRILCLENIRCETLGNLERFLLDDGFEIEKINAKTQEVPKNPMQYSAIIILGGPMSVYDNHGVINEEIDLVKISHKKNVPLLGICLGSQIIAKASGGIVFKGTKKEIGWHKIAIEKPESGGGGGGDLFAGLKKSAPTVFQWHGDTFTLPDEARILARSELYPQAFIMGSLVGIQFHLEVTARMIQSWLRNYKAETISEGIDAQELMKESAAFLTELDEICKVVYSNFCTEFSL
jgi:GMP synthase (glutamine-hydrolysing)